MVLRAHVGKLLAHQVAAETATDAINLAQQFKGPGACARANQLVRAALSISSNIAEACGRGTVPEFRRFLLYARGSAQEVLSQLGIARRLDPALGRRIRGVESRLALVIKLLGRLHDNPPRDR